MASLPTIADVEKEILRIFSRHNVRANEMLMVQSLIASWDHQRFHLSDMGPGLQSLADKGAIELKDGGSSYALFLTDTGYQMMPQPGSHLSATAPSAPIFQGPVTFNVSGNNARVNVGSADNSTNTVNLGQALLDKLITDLESLPDQAGKAQAIEAAKELKAHAGKATWGEKYQRFIDSASKTADVFKKIGPYMGDLWDLLSGP